MYREIGREIRLKELRSGWPGQVQLGEVKRGFESDFIAK